MNKSELKVIKTSNNQSQNLSNNNINKSDSSNEKGALTYKNHKGTIRQSNVSNISCKTYQPNKTNGKVVKEKKIDK
jgi:hypothetical protein